MRRYREFSLTKGRRLAKGRGIRGYRMVQPRPGVYIRVALAKKRGPRGGATVAVTKLKLRRNLRTP